MAPEGQEAFPASSYTYNQKLQERCIHNLLRAKHFHVVLSPKSKHLYLLK